MVLFNNRTTTLLSVVILCEIVLFLYFPFLNSYNPGRSTLFTYFVNKYRIWNIYSVILFTAVGLFILLFVSPMKEIVWIVRLTIVSLGVKGKWRALLWRGIWIGSRCLKCQRRGEDALPLLLAAQIQARDIKLLNPESHHSGNKAPEIPSWLQVCLFSLF